ncbi:phosphotransferase [Streptomyces griseoaurantiacus]|uniref:phosphotransferase n=1 Tax=Streptomyces griseoaurantiacus TaxID=68213 RepID=UPI00379DAF05
MKLSGPPTSPVPVPPSVAALARGRRPVPVWRNELGGLTFRLDGDGRPGGEDPLFVKWAPSGSALPLAAEAERLRWAAPYTPVPEVREYGSDADGSWLATRALPAESAVAPCWKADPATAVRALGTGLRALHDRLPVAECPFTWSVAHRLEVARRAGIVVPADLPDPPPADLLVVCHGDPCAPNTLLHEDGSWAAHVDMGALGVADRWADLAVVTRNIDWNYGPGWERTLLDAYGIAPDPVRTDFYRRLWDAT